MNRVVKNKVLLTLLIIAFCIPTVVAVVSYSRSKNGPVDTKSAVSILICDSKGTETEYSKDTEEGAAVIDVFVKFTNSALPVSALPEQLTESTNFYLVTVSNGSEQFIYKYYFELVGDSYYTDDGGKAYKLDSGAMSEFLLMPAAAGVYSDSAVPVLTLSTDVTNVKADSASWSYKSASGELLNADCTPYISEETLVYNLEGGFCAQFSVDPDFLHVEIQDAASAESLYNGDYENGANFAFSKKTQATVHITAKWYSDDSRGYEGEMDYSFKIEVSDPAAFYLGTESIDVGEVVSVTAINVTKPENIEFSSEPSIGCTPVFYSGENGKAYSIIPVSLDCQGAATYKFTFRYGGVSQDVELYVGYRAYDNGIENTYSVADAVAALYSDATVKEASDALSGIFSQGDSEIYFGGDFFAEPFETGISRFYGRTYTITPGDIEYKQNGLEYKTDDGKEVKAVAKGKVVYAGNLTVAGNIVVIEHGLGLKTVYAHLGSTAVSVGDTVEKGGKIGTAGSTGFTNGAGIYFSVYVGNTPVSPYCMLGTWNGMEDPGTWKTFPEQ